jgi:hypothetical protein
MKEGEEASGAQRDEEAERKGDETRLAVERRKGRLSSSNSAAGAAERTAYKSTAYQC